MRVVCGGVSCVVKSTVPIVTPLHPIWMGLCEELTCLSVSSLQAVEISAPHVQVVQPISLLPVLLCTKGSTGVPPEDLPLPTPRV